MRCDLYLQQRGYVFIAVSKFVCHSRFSRDRKKTIQSIFTKLDGNVAQGPRKKPLDFGDNPDHVTFKLGMGVDYG